MASTVILSAIMEHSLSNLLWSLLVDAGTSRDEANKVVNERMSRHAVISKCRSLTTWTIEDISFPVRNLVAHGKGFGKEEKAYVSELVEQSQTIRQWVGKILTDITPKNFMPKKTERWLLFMDNWSKWLLSFMESMTKVQEKT